MTLARRFKLRLLREKALRVFPGQLTFCGIDGETDLQWFRPMKGVFEAIVANVAACSLPENPLCPSTSVRVT